MYKDGEAYEVEFVTLDGHTAAVATLEVSQVRLVTRRDYYSCPRVASGMIPNPLEDLAAVHTERDKSFYEGKCATLDRQIDQLVYELYELTPEEIAIVEDRSQQSASR